MLIILMNTKYCVTVFPGTNNLVQNNNEELDAAISVRIDVTDSSSQYVEPTMSAGKGEAVTHQITSINEITSENEVGQTKPSTNIEAPEDISTWLQDLGAMPLDMQSNMIGTNTRESEKSETGPNTLQPNLKEEAPLHSPDQLFKLVDEVPPIQKDNPHSGIKHYPNNEFNNESNIHQDIVRKLTINIPDSKRALLICVPVGIVILSLVLITGFIIYKTSTKKQRKEHVNSVIVLTSSVNRNPTVTDVDSKDEVFMGIPTNNKIWKELQMLPPSS